MSTGQLAPLAMPSISNSRGISGAEGPAPPGLGSALTWGAAEDALTHPVPSVTARAGAAAPKEPLGFKGSCSSGRAHSPPQSCLSCSPGEGNTGSAIPPSVPGGKGCACPAFPPSTLWGFSLRSQLKHPPSASSEGLIPPSLLENPLGRGITPGCSARPPEPPAPSRAGGKEEHGQELAELVTLVTLGKGGW